MIKVTVWNEGRHETFPIYYVPEIQTVIKNAVRYCAPVIREELTCPHIEKM